MAEEAGVADNDVERAYDDFIKHVGQRIRAARRRIGIKQVELASAIGVKQPYIVAVEAGENLTLTSLARISAALDVRPMTLLLEGELAVAFDDGLFNRLADVLRRAADQAGKLGGLLCQMQSIVPSRTADGISSSDRRADMRSQHVKS